MGVLTVRAQAPDGYPIFGVYEDVQAQTLPDDLDSCGVRTSRAGQRPCAGGLVTDPDKSAATISSLRCI